MCENATLRPLFEGRPQGRTAISSELCITSHIYGMGMQLAMRFNSASSNLCKLANIHMPRRAHIAMDGIPVHLIQRGNNRQACFFADDDYFIYLHYFAEFADQFACAVRAHVLQTGHVEICGLAPSMHGFPSVACPAKV
jgi:hypothetical protein